MNNGCMMYQSRKGYFKGCYSRTCRLFVWRSKIKVICEKTLPYTQTYANTHIHMFMLLWTLTWKRIQIDSSWYSNCYFSALFPRDILFCDILSFFMFLILANIFFIYIKWLTPYLIISLEGLLLSQFGSLMFYWFIYKFYDFK